jgi:hypothetical protein
MNKKFNTCFTQDEDIRPDSFSNVLRPSAVYLEIGAKKQPILEIPYFQEFLSLKYYTNFSRSEIVRQMFFSEEAIVCDVLEKSLRQF